MEWKSLIICLEGLPISTLLPPPVNKMLITVAFLRWEKKPGKHDFEIIFIILLCFIYLQIAEKPR